MPERIQNPVKGVSSQKIERQRAQWNDGEQKASGSEPVDILTDAVDRRGTALRLGAVDSGEASGDVMRVPYPARQGQSGR